MCVAEKMSEDVRMAICKSIAVLFLPLLVPFLGYIFVAVAKHYLES